VIFRLKGGLVLALYPRSEHAKDADIPFGSPKTGEFSIGQLVESRAEADALLLQADQAGATHGATARSPVGGSTPATSATRRTPPGDHRNPPTENTKRRSGNSAAVSAKTVTRTARDTRHAISMPMLTGQIAQGWFRPGWPSSA
jgi:hypothetical protein